MVLQTLKRRFNPVSSLISFILFFYKMFFNLRTKKKLFCKFNNLTLKIVSNYLDNISLHSYKYKKHHIHKNEINHFVLKNNTVRSVRVDGVILHIRGINPHKRVYFSSKIGYEYVYFNILLKAPFLVLLIEC